MSDFQLKIPILGNINSLNVSDQAIYYMKSYVKENLFHNNFINI